MGCHQDGPKQASVNEAPHNPAPQLPDGLAQNVEMWGLTPLSGSGGLSNGGRARKLRATGGPEMTARDAQCWS